MIKKWIIGIVRKAQVDLPYRISSAATHGLFAYIGIARLRELLNEIEDKGEKYTSLAELYLLTLKHNGEKEKTN